MRPVSPASSAGGFGEAEGAQLHAERQQRRQRAERADPIPPDRPDVVEARVQGLSEVALDIDPTGDIRAGQPHLTGAAQQMPDGPGTAQQ